MTSHHIDPQAVREWAQPILDQANKVGPMPWPGTPAWSELPNNDPRKRAAVIYAALFWCDQHTPEALAERAEFDEYEERRSERQVSWVFSRMTEWGRVPIFAELERRRGTYATPPLSVDQIRAQASQPWSCDRVTHNRQGYAA